MDKIYLFYHRVLARSNEFFIMDSVLASYRIVNAKSAKENCVVSALTVEELRQAEKAAVKRSQMMSFPHGYEAIKKKKPLLTKSQLLSLSPYMDEEGLLHVGG